MLVVQLMPTIMITLVWSPSVVSLPHWQALLWMSSNLVLKSKALLPWRPLAMRWIQSIPPYLALATIPASTFKTPSWRWRFGWWILLRTKTLARNTESWSIRQRKWNCLLKSLVKSYSKLSIVAWALPLSRTLPLRSPGPGSLRIQWHWPSTPCSLLGTPASLSTMSATLNMSWMYFSFIHSLSLWYYLTHYLFDIISFTHYLFEIISFTHRPCSASSTTPLLAKNSTITSPLWNALLTGSWETVSISSSTTNNPLIAPISTRRFFFACKRPLFWETGR